MTKREAAIISAYTGILIGDFNDMHKYIEEIAGRAVFTHELPDVRNKLKTVMLQDFLSIKIHD